jgi:hypothetical protein
METALGNTGRRGDQVGHRMSEDQRSGDRSQVNSREEAQEECGVAAVACKK